MKGEVGYFEEDEGAFGESGQDTFKDNRTDRATTQNKIRTKGFQPLNDSDTEDDGM